MVSQNQEHCDQIIGSDNYDIGHLFAQYEDFGQDRLLLDQFVITGKKAQGVSETWKN